MRRLPTVLALTMLLATPAALPSAPPARAQEAPAAPQADIEAARLIAAYNEQTAASGLGKAERDALAARLDTQLTALLNAAAGDPQRTRGIVAAIKAARLELPLTEEVRAVLETADRAAVEIRKRQDETAIAEIVEKNAGNPDAIAEAVSDYITGSDDPVRSTEVAARMAVSPQYETVKPALGQGIGRAIATLGITQPDLAGRMSAAAQEVDDPALQNAVVTAERDVTGTPTPGPSDTTGSETPNTTPENPASAS